MFFTLVICFLFAGCSSLESQKAFETEPERAELVTEVTETISTTATTEQAASASKIYPLPDTTMDNLSDTILSISLEEGEAYVDDTGKMQMDVTIYSYDKYDMVDISMLKVGDILVTHAGEVEITALERKETGTILEKLQITISPHTTPRSVLRTARLWKCTECILPDSKHAFSYARSRANHSVLMYLFLKTI